MNFKNLLLAASVVTFGLVGCASHPAPVAVNTPPPAPVVTAAPAAPAPPPAPVAPAPSDVAPKDTSFKITANGASLTFPNDSWETAVDNGDMFIVQNSDAEVRLMFAGVTLKGTPASFDKTVTTMISKSGGKIVASKAVKLGEVSGVFHDTVNQRKMHIFVWTATNDGNGWLIQCGSPTNADTKDICTGLANTLAIE